MAPKCGAVLRLPIHGTKCEHLWVGMKAFPLPTAHQVQILYDLLKRTVSLWFPSFSSFVLLQEESLFSLLPFILMSIPHNIQVTISYWFGLFGRMQQKWVLTTLAKKLTFWQEVG